MTVPEQAERKAALEKCREVLAAVAGNRRQYGPIATHAQTALSQLAYADELAAAQPLVGVIMRREDIYRIVCAYSPITSMRAVDELTDAILALPAHSGSGVREDVARALKSALKVTSEHDYRPWAQIEAALLSLPKHTGQPGDAFELGYNAALALTTAAHTGQLEGWQLVPADDPRREHADSALPVGMILAGAEALERCQDDLKEENYIPGEMPDWDSGMTAVAIYRAMLFAAPASPQPREGTP